LGHYPLSKTLKFWKSWHFEDWLFIWNTKWRETASIYSSGVVI